MATDFGGKGSRRTFAARLLREVQAQSALSGTLVPQIAALPAGTLVSTDRLPAVSAGGAGKTLTPANFLAYILPDADKGDITTSASGATWTIDNNVVSYAKLQDASAGNVVLARAAGTSGDYGEVAIGASQLFGRGSTGDVAPITLGTALSMSGTTLNAAGVSDGDKGDITVSASGATWTIDNTAVSYAKIQNVAANSFLANVTGSPASLTEIATSRIPLFASAITGTPSGSTYLRGDGTWATVSGSGDVVGPASATDNAIARFDLTTGKLLQNSNAILTDAGTLTLDAGSTTNALVVTTTGSIKQSIRHDSGNRWDTTVSSGGFVSFNAVGSDARFGFEDRVSVSVIDDDDPALQVSATGTNAAISTTALNMTAQASHTSGTMASLIGIIAQASIQGTGGTVTAATGLRASVSRGNGTLVDGIGVDVQALSSTMTNAYGIRVGNVTGGSSLNYAIYTGTGLVRFGDAVTSTSTITGTSLIGTTRVTAPLIGTTTATDVVFDRNSVTQLTLGSLLATFAGSVNAVTEYRVAGTKVVGAQGATISDPTGGTVQDSEARTAINTIIDRLQAHGLIA